MPQPETASPGALSAEPAAERPLSHGQQRLWFLHRFDPGDPSYNTSYVYRLKGFLDKAALAAAFTAVAARHESLRTRFREVDGEPVAVVEPPAPVVVHRLAARDEQEARDLVASLTNTAFDLTAAPPFRVTLIELGPDDHVLCVVVHHINSDGWSLNVLRAEVAAHYGSRGAAPLPALPLQYGEHARERRWTDDDLRWWTARLAGVPPLDLPADRPRPARRSWAGDALGFRIGPERAAAIAALARRARCTPYMVLFAAYQVLLARHTGQDDFCVGTPSAGRDRVELEPMIGFLSSTLPVRCDMSGDPSFTELLRRTRRSVLDALARQDVPFERLVSELDVPRDLGRTPVFQTMFALHTHGEDADPLPGLAAVPFPNGWHPARHDLSVDVAPAPDGALDGTVIYSTELFDRETVVMLVERFQELLASAVAEPDLPVGALRMLPEAELDLLDAWNATGADLPEATLADLVLAQAEATPGAVAVVCGAQTLTYAELAARAARVAARLAAAGVGRGSLVAIRMERGPDLLPALLGTAMSGAAYLPVDPGYPEARVAYVLEDSAAALVLTSLDDLPPAPAAPGAADPPRPGDTAYVLYTSGSTGRPKGVAVPHRALVNFLLAMRSLVGSTPRDVWLALTSLSFDISALELYLPLVTGGRVVVADAGTAVDGAEAARLVRETGVTHVQATPSGWRVLLTGDLPRVTALTGGEPLPPRLARELRPRVERLVNVYGPTETTVWSTAWEVPADPGGIVIGRPIANTTVHVVDAAGETVPIGSPGELLIGGAGVATGYLGRPALTAERFVPGPGGSRRYRTGDRVRLLRDGTLEFLGRTDHQVKLRGHRIEPGEIEAVLDACPGVRQSVAAVRGDLLVAYVVPDPVPGTESGTGTGTRAGTASAAGAGSAAGTGATGHAAQTADASGPYRDLPDLLRERLARELPGYMVPGVLTVVDALPLTPNGKIDRSALPEPPAPAREHVAPRGDAEELVAEVFAEVLGVTGIGAFDDFFALGGHSLSAARVVSRIRALAEVDVPIRTLFARSTVAGLAAEVEELLVAELAALPEEEARRLMEAGNQA
ncbi:amino acid adenylation domain-containing protein [Planomonospora sp. ID91781]|uniref:non-ribosomal peptide synthetase n=1 Tax=Planomonospora sp. ID91781 TaxID=2738135 RepID=UPI0018C406ED|nr:non-ribosomal peptide synthetase [Planomonospora sp. ID91781]MBG0821564.1 amino acid adenylation domain-containing protein [Planomonospora sp. ID91781]